MPALADWFLAGAQRGFRNVYELELQSVPKTDGILEMGIIGSVLKRGDRVVCSSADADIVPVAEKLDHRVLELVVAELAASPTTCSFVSTSRPTLPWTRIGGFDRIAVARAFRMPERLTVGITETVAIQDVDALRGFVTRLKNFSGRGIGAQRR